MQLAKNSRGKAAAEFIAYTAASAIALALDYAVYWFLAQSLGMAVGAAAAAGYGAGLVLAYGLISRGVFARRWLAGRRGLEALLFALSGLLGLALTYVTASLVDRWGGSLHAAKLSAVAVSFITVFLVRRFIVFRRRGVAPASGQESIPPRG